MFCPWSRPAARPLNCFPAADVWIRWFKLSCRLLTQGFLLKIDSPLYCPAFNGFEGASLFSADARPDVFSFPLSSNVMMQVLATLCVGLVCRAADPSVHHGFSSDNRNLTLRACVENEQYPHQGLCCRNCEAGKRTDLCR